MKVNTRYRYIWMSMNVLFKKEVLHCIVVVALLFANILFLDCHVKKKIDRSQNNFKRI